MKYAAIHTYAGNPDLIAVSRPAHRAYLTTLIAKGQLVVAGPFLDDSGALIVYETESPEAAEALIRADPFHEAGVFQSWQLKPWKTVFGNPGLLPPQR
jgi:uncharacterized protein YciI